MLCRPAFLLPFEHLAVVGKIDFPDKIPNNPHFLSVVSAWFVRRVDDEVKEVILFG